METYRSYSLKEKKNCIILFDTEINKQFHSNETFIFYDGDFAY